MADFDPDAYLAANTSAAVAEPPAFDPDAYLKSKAPVASASTGFDPDAYLKSKAAPTAGLDYLRLAPEPSDEAAAANKLSRDNPVLENAAGGLVDTAKSLVPKSLSEALGFLSPVVGAYEDLRKSVGAIRDVADGKTVEEAARANRPEDFILADAEQTPAGSRERFSAGFGMLTQMLMGAGIVHGLKARPGLSETLFPEEKAPAPAPPAPAEVAAHSEEISKAAGVPQEIPPATAGEPIEQAPMAEVIAPEPTLPVAVEGQPSAVPVEAAQAKLLPGETQGDLISSTQPEDLTLVGEKGIDHAARQSETEAAAQRAEEARLKAEHEQGLLSDFQEHQARGGDELLDAIESGGGLPAKSSRHSDTLSGELKNIREEIVSETGKQKYGFDYNKIFKSGAPDLDTLTQHLRSRGFDVETPNDTLSLIQDRLRSGEPVHGNEARAAALEEASYGGFGLGIKSAPFAEPFGARSAIDTWVDRARSLMDVGSSIKRFVENAPQRDEVAAKFDAANNQAGYVARQARNHVELAGREAELPERNSELAQKAATFVRQANGDKAGMIAKLDSIRGKGFDDVIAYAKKNWDALEKISDAAKSGTDAAHQEAKAAGAEVDYRDNYVKGAYHDPVTQKVVFDETGGGSGTGTSFKKAKVFNDYAEAIAAGFKPRELRLDVLTESAVNSMLRSVNRRAWANSIGEIKMPDGLPAAAPSAGNGSAPRGYRPVQVTPGNLVNIHADLAPVIEALTANSIIPRILSHASSFVKHNILVYDIYHGSRFAQMQAAFEGKIPSYQKGLSLLEFADKDLAAAQKHGLISADEAKFAQENRPKIEGLMQHGLNVGRISDAIYAEAVPLMPGAKATNNFIFQKLSRGIITQSAVYALDRNATLHPEWTPKELNRYTAKEINTYYRNLGSQGVFKSKTFQDMARLISFAPQWNEGMIRSEARGIGQLGKVATTGSLGNLGKGMSTGLVAYFAFSQLVNLLTRGKPTWENPEPGHKFDAWIPDFAQGSNGFFVSPLSVFAETTHDALKYTERGMEPLDVTAQILNNKLHPDVRAMRDLFGGKDFYGRPLHGWERVTQAASEVAPIPMIARSGGYKGGAERQVLSTLGIKATPAPSSAGDVYQLASEFKRKNGIKVDDTFRESDYAKLRKALSSNDIDAAQSEYDALKTSKGRQKVEQYFEHLTKRPFTGSRATEKKFRATLDRGQTDLYTSALREREEIAQRYRALRR